MDLIDRTEEEETICLESAVSLKKRMIKSFLAIGGVLHNPDHIATNFILGIIENLIILLIITSKLIVFINHTKFTNRKIFYF